MQYRGFGTGRAFWLAAMSLALGLGVCEAAFVLAARQGIAGVGFSVLPVLAALVVTRFFLQVRLSAVEISAMAEGVSAMRARLLRALQTRAVPAYRSPIRAALAQALQEKLPRTGEGFLAQIRFFAAMAQAVILIPCLFFLSWRLALGSLPLALPAWWAVRWRGRALRALEREETRARSQGREALEEFGDGLETSLGGGNMDAAAGRLESEWVRYGIPDRQWRLAQARYPALLETFFFFGLAGLVWAGGRFAALSGWESWLLFSGLLLLAYRPLREAARAYPLRLQGMQALRDCENLAEEWEKRPARALPRAWMDSKGEALAFRGVTFGYSPSRPVFREFSARFEMGRITGITGPNGSGKTTLLRLLSSLEIPDSGAVLWPDSLRQLGRAEYLPQRVFIPADFPKWAATFAALHPESWAELDGLLGLSSLLRDGFHPAALSGGERQRLALGRALASDAPFLLLDEPTTALPGDEREGILESGLRLWARGRSGGNRRGAVVVSHEPFLGRLCDSLFALNARTPSPVPAGEAGME